MSTDTRADCTAEGTVEKGAELAWCADILREAIRHPEYPSGSHCPRYAVLITYSQLNSGLTEFGGVEDEDDGERGRSFGSGVSLAAPGLMSIEGSRSERAMRLAADVSEKSMSSVAGPVRKP
jgi:hypothetical protein